MPTQPETWILIHGAWAGPWVWDALVPELEARGHDAVALALPGDGTHATAPAATTPDKLLDAVGAAIDAAAGPVTLVGHSGGGMLVTAAAEAWPQRVTRGIWIAGMLIPDGRSFEDIQNDVMGAGLRFGVTPHVVLSATGESCTVPEDVARRCLFNDAPPVLADQAIGRMTPQPTAGHRLRTCTSPAFDRLPKLYVLLENDRSVIPRAQQAMAASTANVTLHTLATGHFPQLTHPAALADLLHDWTRLSVKTRQ